MSSATQNCEFCGSPAHVWFACTKKPDGWKPERLKKSTAARKDVRPLDGYVPKSRKVIATSAGSIPAASSANDVAPKAGTQAPPVDTLKQAEADAAHLAPKRGRPKTITDMRAYKREKERKRRAAKKAGK